jgi:3-hydroxyisobutyrate dehydrogenase-like beta-hydroxyacid dehydrogenase
MLDGDEMGMSGTRNQPLGFIGLGKMGLPMVRRLLSAGFPVHVFNRSSHAIQELAAEGALPCSSATEIGQRAELVMTALPTLSAVADVYRELTPAARAGQIYIDHSTVNPELSRRCAEELGARGADFLDAPVSGGPAGAASGTLTVMVGGQADVLDRAVEVLRAYGENIRLCGPTGAGEAVKLVNQLLVAIHTLASAEATVFGQRLGIGPDLLLEALGTSFGNSRMLSRNLPRFASRDFSPATPVDLILKDLRIIESEAGRMAVDLHLGRVATDAFAQAAAKGLGGEDMAGLIKLLEELAAGQ